MTPTARERRALDRIGHAVTRENPVLAVQLSSAAHHHPVTTPPVVSLACCPLVGGWS